ncbi:D-alanyl-D-alanine carboxypeptidase family protein [Candidatus Nomurabacteria bacterium]|nr:D-alanyl-D-alanine carboxypeptidase family protein [Candidatus Nomurabacteria bacterium]
MAKPDKDIRVRRKKQLTRATVIATILLCLTALAMGGFYIGKNDVGTSDDGSSDVLNIDEVSLNTVLFKGWEEALEKDRIEAEKAIEEAQNDSEEEKKLSDQSSEPQPATDPSPESQPPSDTQPSPSSTNNWWSYPAIINTIPASAVTLSTVVNKGNKLASDYVPPNLTLLQNISGIRIPSNKQGTIYVRSEMIPALTQLGAAAQNAGIDLSIVSAYRSYSTQASTYNYWVSYNGGNVDAADQVSARPGHSEHQLGTVVDFSTSAAGDAVGAAFHGTVAAAWLAENAPTYGFRLSYPAGQEWVTGYAHESWHWRWWSE